MVKALRTSAPRVRAFSATSAISTCMIRCTTAQAVVEAVVANTVLHRNVM